LIFPASSACASERNLIIDRKTEQEYIEIKATETYRYEMTRPIEQMKTEIERGYLLYQGKGEHSTPDLQIMNYKDYLKLPHHARKSRKRRAKGLGQRAKKRRA
jgi:hypothetical protein